MPDIFSHSESKSKEERVQPQLRMASRVDNEGHLLDKDGSNLTYSQPRDVTEYSPTIREMKRSRNPLAAFVSQPLKFQFSTQAANEKVILLLRQHPATQVKWLLLATLGVFFPLITNYINFLDFLPASYQTAVIVGWFLVLTGFIVESFLKWYYNVYIITDERIIDVDFNSLLFRNISSAKIDKIEDTTAMTAGFLSVLFDFGTVIVQTAAEKREFEFNGIPHPSKVTTLINDLILEEEREVLEGRVS